MLSLEKNNLRIGLNLPLFAASLVTLFSGTFSGLVGIWAYLAWKLVVPEYIKVGHAHTSWWSVLILLSALFLPALSLKPKVKKFIIWTSFIAPVLWLVCLAVYYISKTARGTIAPLPAFPGEFGPEYLVYGTGIFVMEVWFFGALFLVLVSALGFKIPGFSQEAPTSSKYDLMSEIEIPRRVLWIPLIFGTVGILLGWYMTLMFKATHKAIDPSALVQFHCHIVFFAVGFLLTLLTFKAIGASQRGFNIARWLGVLAIPLIWVGYVLFIRVGLPSFVYVTPALIYYTMMLTGLAGLIGFFGLKPEGDHFHYVRGAMIFNWTLLLILIAVGIIIALVWDTNSNLTVTYKQPEGIAYPGPYPAHYVGTQPVGHTPRGLENAHLSPGSWSHVALFWLLTLMLFGEKIFQKLGKPNLFFLIVTTIPLAPFFNAVGRFAAWQELPYGIGSLYYAGHPLKMFNILFLFLTTLCVISKIRKTR